MNRLGTPTQFLPSIPHNHLLTFGNAAELNQTNMMLPPSTVFTRTTPTIAYPDLFSDAIVPRTPASSLTPVV